MIKPIFKAVTRTATVAIVSLIAATTVAQDTVMFNYQGRVKVQETEFQGQGQFKFAILSPDKKSVLWTNDGSSNPGGEPTVGVNLSVTDGVFNVVMGANGIMEPINSTIFQNREPLKLRTWFNDGVHGFEALQPDHNLINVTLITSTTGSDDFIIYVNGETGNDSNSGLQPAKAKKTIQAAVDIIPVRVMADVVIDIADGVYPEEVLLYGINVKPGKALTLRGDENWTPASTGVPAVIVTGADGSTVGVRKNGLMGIQCTGVEIVGICFEAARESGLQLENGKFTVKNCVTRNNGFCGFTMTNQVRATVENHLSTGNQEDGIVVSSQSRAIMTAIAATHNTRMGLFMSDSSTVNIHTSANFSNNGQNGMHVIGSSQIGTYEGFNGTVRDNQKYGMVAGWYSYYHNFDNRLLVTGNLQGDYWEFKGGEVYWEWP